MVQSTPDLLVSSFKLTRALWGQEMLLSTFQMRKLKPRVERIWKSRVFQARQTTPGLTAPLRDELQAPLGRADVPSALWSLGGQKQCLSLVWEK